MWRGPQGSAGADHLPNLLRKQVALYFGVYCGTVGAGYLFTHPLKGDANINSARKEMRRAGRSLLDEVALYQHCRCVCYSEALFRLFEFSQVRTWPNVTRISVCHSVVVPATSSCHTRFCPSLGEHSGCCIACKTR